MTNYDYVKGLNITEMAKLLVKEYVEYCYDDDDIMCDEDLSTSYTYITPDGDEFDYEQEAINYTIQWLKNEKID